MTKILVSKRVFSFYEIPINILCIALGLFTYGQQHSCSFINES